MKKAFEIAQRKGKARIVIILIAALAILSTQSLYYHYLDSFDQQASLEMQDDNGEEFPILQMSQDAVVSVAQLSINQTLDFISEIVLSEDLEERRIPKALRLDGYFDTLFNLIISPNAP